MILFNRLEKYLKTHSLSNSRSQFCTEDIQQMLEELLERTFGTDWIAEELLMLRLVRMMIRYSEMLLQMKKSSKHCRL